MKVGYISGADIEDLVQFRLGEVGHIVCVINEDIGIYVDAVTERIAEDVFKLEWQEAPGNNIGTLNRRIELPHTENSGEVLVVKTQATVLHRTICQLEGHHVLKTAARGTTC